MKTTPISTIQSLCEFIWSIEKKFDLLDFEIKGVKIWQYIRMELYYKIAQCLNILEEADNLNLGISAKLKHLPSLFAGLTYKNPFIFSKNISTLIIDHPRSKLVEGKKIDIYTHYLIQKLQKDHKSYAVIERSYKGGHTKYNDSNRFYLDSLVLLTRLINIVLPCKINKDVISFLHTIENEIHKKTGIHIDLSPIIKRGLNKFIIGKHLYSLLLRRLRPKRIFLVISYALGDIIQAARELSIETIEIQHGIISRYHLGYNFPDIKVTPAYFPDKILVWGEYWKEFIGLPSIYADNIVIGNFEYFHACRNNYNKVNKKKATIIILSQNAISDKIADFILKALPNLKEYTIHYKLHPKEYHKWAGCKNLKELSDMPNVTIHLDTDLYELFSLSEYQIGVFSTSIYEGLGFGCKTILLNINGIESMKTLLDKNIATSCNTPTNILQALQNIDTHYLDNYNTLTNFLFGKTDKME